MNRRWFVYLISEHGGQFCKIGRSSNVEKRLSYLATSNPRKLSVVMAWEFCCRRDSVDVERLALDAGSRFRVGRSEWLMCSVVDAFRIIENAMGDVVGVPS